MKSRPQINGDLRSHSLSYTHTRTHEHIHTHTYINTFAHIPCMYAHVHKQEIMHEVEGTNKQPALSFSLMHTKTHTHIHTSKHTTQIHIYPAYIHICISSRYCMKLRPRTNGGYFSHTHTHMCTCTHAHMHMQTCTTGDFACS